MNSPLSHIKVLDLSRVLAGPWATQMLGDLGAEVIKIERPRTGDDTRHWGPPFIHNPDGSQGDAAYFLCANRNKTSVVLDISTSEGQDKVKALARDCDVVVENYKVGGLKKYGLDYDSLNALNPGLVYCSITGFGQTGPYAARPGYDFLIQAMGGMMSITGEKDGLPGGGPQKVGVAIADVMTGMYAAVGILAALAHRDRTGEGQHLDIALLDCLIASLANQNMNYLIGGQVPERLGNAHPNIVPYQAFATRDSHLILAIGNDAQFRRFAELNGQDWAARAEFSSNQSRVEHRNQLIPLIEEVMQQRTTREWVSLLEQNNIPCGPVNTLKETFADPQVIHRQMVREMVREDGVRLPTISNPINFSKTPVQYRRSPPKLSPEE